MIIRKTAYLSDSKILDELTIKDDDGLFFHLEQMSKDHYWLRIQDQEYDLILTDQGLKLVEKE